MSAEHEINSEPELTDALSSLETQLKQLTPAASNANREELMYQAGWAAAEAHAAGRAAVPGSTRWYWPAISATLAASLLFVLTNPEARPLQRTERATNPPAVTEPEPRTPPTTSQASVPKLGIPRLKQFPPQARMLAMRERALRFEFDEPTVADFASDGPGETATSRELLREFLPEAPTGLDALEKPRPWWTIFRSGESA